MTLQRGEIGMTIEGYAHVVVKISGLQTRVSTGRGYSTFYRWGAGENEDKWLTPAELEANVQQYALKERAYMERYPRRYALTGNRLYPWDAATALKLYQLHREANTAQAQEWKVEGEISDHYKQLARAEIAEKTADLKAQQRALSDEAHALVGDLVTV